MSSAIGMNMVSRSCSPLRSSSVSSIRVCAASIAAGRAASGLGRKVPRAKRGSVRVTSSPQIAAGQVQEHVLQGPGPHPQVSE